MTSSTEGRIEIAPREAGYDEAKLKTLEEYLAHRIDAGKLQGASFLMARRGKVFAHRALGRLTPEPAAPPLRPDSLKGLASLTKPFTATAVLKLVEEGKLWLGQPVKTVLPELDNPMHGEITFWHLLTHTSGLPPDGGYLCEPYPIPRFEWFFQEKDWVAKGISGPVVCRPGEAWNYCTMGYNLLAEAVTRVSGKHFYDYVEQEILAPLGMTRTFFAVPEALRPELAWSSDWQRERSTRERADGGGGLISTLPDLLRFARCFLAGGELDGRRILGRKTVEEMTRNQLPPGTPAFHWGKRLGEYRHGLGWGYFCDGSTVGPATYNHEGYGWCALYVDPVEQFVYAHFTCDAGPWDPAQLVIPRTIAFSGLT